MPSYIINTQKGCVPHVIDYNEEYFRQPRKVFLDDFVFKDSFYCQGGREDLKKFIGSDQDIALGFRITSSSKPRILTSKKGNYKISKEEYTKVLENMCIHDNFADFESGELYFNGKKVVEPENLDDYLKLRCDETVITGTEFINNLIEEGKMLFIVGDNLECKHITETEKEYEKYLWSIKEMGAWTFISEWNYKTLYEYSKIK